MNKYYENLSVAVYKTEPVYSEDAPYNPHDAYPEYLFKGDISPETNPAYEAVRNCFHLLRMDEDNYGTSNWNPLAEIIRPGHKVVIKPNFVVSRHYEGGNVYSIITHPSILRAIVDYVYIALDGEGEIIIADAPQMDCNFDELLEKTKLQCIREFYRDKKGFEISILDLRDWWLDKKSGDAPAFAEWRKKLPGDPLGSTIVNLGKKSEFYGQGNHQQFYGADYDREETIRHHHGDVQEYMISRTVLDADVVISVPKLKVHKKVGVTLNGKGLVGINTNKNFIVHYTLGSPEDGGDQYPSQTLSGRERLLVKTQRFLFDALLSKKSPALDSVFMFITKFYRRMLRPVFGSVSQEKALLDAGNWHGNDTAWRMVSDLMKISIYADRNGILQESQQRKVFSIIDGIIGGENNGPLTPDEKKAGVVIAGFNPLAVDLAGIRLMGFDWKKLKWAVNLLSNEHLDFILRNVKNIEIVANIDKYNEMFKLSDGLLSFRPHPGWEHNIEIT